MLLLIKEVYERLPFVNDENKALLIKTLCKIFEQHVLNPFNKFDNHQVLARLFIITIQYGKRLDLAPTWKSFSKWRHHQYIITNFFISLLESFGDSIYLATIQNILKWINNALIKEILLSKHSPRHITDRNPFDNKIIQLFNEALKTFAAKKRLYDPQSIFDAHAAFILLSPSLSKMGDWFYYSLIFAFDPTSDEYLCKLAHERIDANTDTSLEYYLDSLEDSTVDLLISKSFECGCNCDLKSTSILSWRIFGHLAPSICSSNETFSKIMPAFLSYFKELVKGINSIEKSISVILASLDSIIELLLASATEKYKDFLIHFCNMLCLAPKEELFIKGHNLASKLNISSNLNQDYLARGLFCIPDGSNVLPKYNLLKDLFLSKNNFQIDFLTSLDPSLVPLWKRPSLRSQFWIKLIPTFYKDTIDSFIRGFLAKGNPLTLTFLNCSLHAIPYLKKSTLLSIIDKLASHSEEESDVNKDECENFLKKFIPELETMQDYEACSELCFEISPFDFDTFTESLLDPNKMRIIASDDKNCKEE
jgi:hypothetical protein